MFGFVFGFRTLRLLPILHPPAALMTHTRLPLRLLTRNLPKHSQVICDHLGLGVKTGLPYVVRPAASGAGAGPLVDSAPAGRSAEPSKGAAGSGWHEDLVPFFQGFQLSESCASVADAYLEIADEVGGRAGGSVGGR